MNKVDYIKDTYMGDWVVQVDREIGFNEVLELGNNEETDFKLEYGKEVYITGNLNRIIDRLESKYNPGKIRTILKTGTWYVREEVIDKF